jgi:hypothetical protein
MQQHGQVARHHHLIRGGSDIDQRPIQVKQPRHLVVRRQGSVIGASHGIG